MTDEEISKVIALLDDAKQICTAAQAKIACRGKGRDEPTATGLRPGTSNVVHIYWAGCRGLAELAQRLAAAKRYVRVVSKIGSTEGQIEERLSILGQDKYGAVHRVAGQDIESPGFARWIAQAIRTTRRPTDSAISVTARTIDVMLPHGMTRRQFDLGLRKALTPFSLEGQGVVCFTKYSGLDRLSRATELVIGPNPRDADFLLEIVERILAEHRVRSTPSPGFSTSRSLGACTVEPLVGRRPMKARIAKPSGRKRQSA